MLQYISSNNSRPWINPLPVKFKCNVIQQNWSVRIKALKINQGTKFGTLKMPIFSLFDVIIF